MTSEFGFIRLQEIYFPSLINVFFPANGSSSADSGLDSLSAAARGNGAFVDIELDEVEHPHANGTTAKA